MYVYIYVYMYIQTIFCRRGVRGALHCASPLANIVALTYIEIYIVIYTCIHICIHIYIYTHPHTLQKIEKKIADTFTSTDTDTIIEPVTRVDTQFVALSRSLSGFHIIKCVCVAHTPGSWKAQCTIKIGNTQTTLNGEGGQALRSASNQSSEPREVAQYLQQEESRVTREARTRVAQYLQQRRHRCERQRHSPQSWKAKCRWMI